jgi:hypothetical protein
MSAARRHLAVRDAPGVDRLARGVALTVALTLLLLGAGVFEAGPPYLGAPAPGWAQTVGDNVPDVRLTLSDITGVLGPGSVVPPPEDDVVPPTEDVVGEADGGDDGGEPPGTPGTDAADGGASSPDEATQPLRAAEVEDALAVRALIENVDDVPVDALRLVIEIYPPALTRGLLRQALNGDPQGSPLHVHSPEVRDGGVLGPGEIAGVEDTFEPDEVDWADGFGGVHPVRIAVVRGTAVLDELVTAVVWLADLPTEPVLTSIVWPVDAQPWRGPNGVYPTGADRELRPGGRLRTLLTAAETWGRDGLTLAPAAHLLEDLADRSDGYVVEAREGGGPLERREVSAEDGGAQLATVALRRIREIVAEMDSPPVSGVYAGAHLPGLLAGDDTTGELAAIAAVDGRRRLQLQLGREIDGTTTLLDGPIDAASLDLIPGEAVILPYSATTGLGLGPDPAIPPAVRPVRAASGRLLTALVSDPYLAEALAASPNPAGPAAEVQRVVAESAMAYLTAPNRAGRALIVQPPRQWEPSLTVAGGTLEALRQATWLDLQPPSAVANRAVRGEPPVELRPVDLPDADAVAALGATSRDLDAVVGAAPEATGRVSDRPTGELRDDLLRSTSHWWGTDEPSAVELVRAVRSDIDEAFGDVTIAAGGVTLTSDTGQVPITLQRTEGGPLVVVVEVLSQGRLLWPDGRRSEPIVLEPGESQTVTFTTSSVSTGTFPVTVRVSDPTMTRELGTATLSVRATAISGTALTAIAVLVLVLLLLGTLRRRDRRPTLAVVEEHPERDLTASTTRTRDTST